MLNGLIQWIYLGSLLDFKLNLALFLCSFKYNKVNYILLGLGHKNAPFNT